MSTGKIAVFSILFLVLALSFSSFADPILITGSVLDQSGKGIDKAQVRLVVAAIQTETDASGNFTLSGTTAAALRQGTQAEFAPVLVGRTLHFAVPSDNKDVSI